MIFSVRLAILFALSLFSCCFAEDKPLFMGLIIKDNDATIGTFLSKIDGLEYDKKAIRLRVDILNDTPAIIKEVKDWCENNEDRYFSVKCEKKSEPASAIKNSYLREDNDVDWIFITSSDVFAKPFTLQMLVSKNLPVVVPLLRPLPRANDPFRNFYLSATESGYYKYHPDYKDVAERKKAGTFRADCVHGMYLIHAAHAHNLSFDDGSTWDFIAFSNTARKNNISQFISNEKEYGFFIHTEESPKTLELSCLSKGISRDKIKEISSVYYDNDPLLKEYQEMFLIDNYALYPVKDDLFWVDEKWDWVKSNYIKKGLVWEPHIERLFQQYVREGDTVIDIGGHIGTHTMALSRYVGFTGKVHVFEPQAKLFTELLVNASLNGCENVYPHRVALGSSEGIAYIDHPCATNEGMAQISSKGEKVKVKTLDSFDISNVSLIKIDIEGYEIEALKGAMITLQRNQPVMIVEVFRGPEQAEKLNFIRTLGYEVSHLEDNDYLCIPVKRNKKNLL